MERLGISWDGYAHNTFINGLCKAVWISDVNEVLNKFKEQGFIPNHRTHNSIINGFLKEGNMNSAVSVFHEMGKLAFHPMLLRMPV